MWMFLFHLEHAPNTEYLMLIFIIIIILQFYELNTAQLDYLFY